MAMTILARAASAPTLAMAAMVAGGLFLSGCSAVPDWADPFSSSQPQAADPAEFPEVADVPEAPVSTTSVEQRREIVDGLVADRDLARHSGEVLRGGQITGASPAASPAASPVAAPTATPAGSDIVFDAGQSSLDERELTRVAALGQALASRDGVIVKVTGYAGDATVESDAANGAELAKARASAVAQLLAVAGVPAEKILVGVPDPMPVGDAQALRRVTIAVE